MDKGSFTLYTSYKKHLNILSREQKGDLLDALFLFSETGQSPTLDPVTSMAFSFINEDIMQNNKKWEETKEKRALAGRQGGLAKASKPKQTVAKLAVNDNVNVDVNVNGNNGISSEPHASDKPKFTPEHKAYQCAVFLDKEICERLPKKKHVTEAQLQKWADEFDKVRRIDGYDDDMIAEVLEFSQSDEFWQRNILSGEKFRKQFVKLYAQMGGKRH